MISPKPPFCGAMPRLLVFSTLVFAFALASKGLVGAAPPVSLSSLEAEVPSSPVLQADELSIQAAEDDVRATRDKTGLAYTYANQLGPEAIIVPYTVDDHVLRFEQAAGMRLPLEGTLIAQQLSILDAEKREQIARIALNQAYRERIAQLREAYVQYSTDIQQVGIEQTYLTGSVNEHAQAIALLKEGFWTQTDFLDYANTLEEVRAQQDEDRDLASAQLALIASALGRPVDPFDPIPVSFYSGCSADRVLALQSAYAVDATLAQLQAEQVEVATELAKVRGSSIDASAEAHVGSQTDINHQVSGYDLAAGIDVSLPTHARDEERALRAQYSTQLQALLLRQEQRRVELGASIDAVLAQLASEKAALDQALAQESARTKDVTTAIAHLNTIKQEPQVSFADVHGKVDELYVSRRAVAAVQSELLLQANNLLMIAPGACGGHFDAIPPFVPRIKAASRTKAALRKSTAPPPPPQNH